MKDSLKILIYIILVILITSILCIIFIKPKVLNFKVTEEYTYIQNNKKDIEETIIRYKTQLGEICYKLDIKEAYKILNNITIKKETGFCSAPYLYLEFYFKDDVQKEIHFECENLFYKGKRYELKDKVILFNKDEYLPDKITKGMIIISNKDKIDCK